MSAGVYNFTIEPGTNLSKKLIIKDSSNALVDLTGFIFAGQVRKNYNDQNKVAQFSFSIADQNTNKGEVTFSLTPNETSAFTYSDSPLENTFKYDIIMTTGVNQISRVIAGIITISPEVTR